MSRVELPPLPPCDVGIAGQIKFAHSDDAMRRYGIACARAALESAEDSLCDLMRLDNYGPLNSEWNQALDAAVQAIRALAVGSGGANE